jgi:tRNA (adenine37-N6)-methyltransferase
VRDTRGAGAEKRGERETLGVEMHPIGYIRTESEKVPRHWTISDVEGTLEIDRRYTEGLKDIKAGHRVVVIFYFHKSPEFEPEHLVQSPPHRKGERVGVFSICSPIRPNPIGISILEVLSIEENCIRVKGLDALDGTPILDLKPYVTEE